MTVCFATHNENKLKEIRNLLGSGLHIISLTELGVSEEIPETGQTIEENSAIKARFIYNNYNIPVFADDTGLEVQTLNNEPGVYSARYAGPAKSDQDNIALLLRKLEAASNRMARFKTVVTYIDAETEKQFTGIAEGEITRELSGNEGFGYDPVFKPTGENRTFAEMSLDEKNKISHRRKAFDLLIEFLKK